MKIYHPVKHDPIKIRQSMCVAASIYIDLKLHGALVGSFSDFFARQVNLGSIDFPTPFCKDIPAIVRSYGYKHKRSFILPEFLQAVKIHDHGMIRHKSITGGHTLNWYVQDNKVYASDVGHIANHGKLLNTIVTPQNFLYFEYLTVG